MTHRDDLQQVPGWRMSRRTFTRAVGLGMAAASTMGAMNLSPAMAAGSISFANWASAETATKANIDKALAVFAQTNTVKINNIAIPFDQVLQQLTTMTNGGNPPDVMQ